ncbi:MAG: hypothetical protein JST01_03675 [Cyanobacteria bacterium SZAS TMP-1]|nr:hypothetical protein [Cyanobacteria bacterium SZAS TMP-1]
MNQAVVCIAADVTEAEKEVETLKRAGFTNDDISVLWPDMAGAQELGYEHHTKAPEGMALGVFWGALVGVLTAYLNFAGILWTPWAANLVNAGMPIALFAGAGAGGTFGFLLGALIGLAFPEYEAKKYERKIKVGSTLVAVHTDSAAEIKSAEEALKATGAMGVHHIEERARCKSKCSTINDKAAVKVTTLLLVLAACGIAAARADEATTTSAQSTVLTKTGTEISPDAKKDEMKTEMPPDVTSTKTIETSATDSGKAKIETKTVDSNGSCKTKVKVKTSH